MLTYKFTGKELDEETGLYYFGARYYDSKTSVFISADPIYDGVKEGFGVYTYCRNNPMKYTDPTGLETKYDGSELRNIPDSVPKYGNANGQHPGSHPGNVPAQTAKKENENVDYTGVKVTRGAYSGVSVTSGPWTSSDGKNLYYGETTTDAKGKTSFTSKTEILFKDKLEVIEKGNVLYTAQVQSTPDLIAHQSGIEPFTVPEGKYDNIGLADYNSPTYGKVPRLFPFAVLIHGKTGTSGRANGLGCTITYDNTDLVGIYNAIDKIKNKQNQFNVWIKKENK